MRYLTGPAGEPGPSCWDALPEVDDTPLPGGSVDLPVAVGGDLTAATLVGAYRRGAFPWPSADAGAARGMRRRFGAAVADGRIVRVPGHGPVRYDIPWWSPDPRGVLPVSRVHVSRSLSKRIRVSDWTTTVDHAFVDVVRECGRGRPQTWITSELADSYGELNALGWAHSLEVWKGDELVGGMFGVLVGAAFMAESMFHRQTDASKVALVDFSARFAHAGGRLVDVQFVTPHVRSMGAVEVPREQFLAVLREVRDLDVRLDRDRMPVTRLAELTRAARPGRPATGRIGAGRTGLDLE